MRLDLFLKTSRLVSRRSVAQDFCDKGLVSVNGATAKSAKEIRPGDEIEIRRRDRTTVIRVLAVPAGKQVSKTDASALWETVREESADG